MPPYGVPHLLRPHNGGNEHGRINAELRTIVLARRSGPLRAVSQWSPVSCGRLKSGCLESQDLETSVKRPNAVVGVHSSGQQMSLTAELDFRDRSR